MLYTADLLNVEKAKGKNCPDSHNLDRVAHAHIVNALYNLASWGRTGVHTIGF